MRLVRIFLQIDKKSYNDKLLLDFVQILIFCLIKFMQHKFLINPLILQQLLDIKDSYA